MPRVTPLEPGLRDRVITIQQRTRVLTTSRVPADTWTTLVAGMPASKEDVSGRERVLAAQDSARFDAVFVINYRPDMDPDLVDVPADRRIVFSGRAFNILQATQIGRREGIELTALGGSRLPA